MLDCLKKVIKGREAIFEQSTPKLLIQSFDQIISLFKCELYSEW